MPDLREILPPWVHDPLDRLHELGVPIFAVGGTTRDHLLGRATDDVDLASPLAPPALRDAFRTVFGDLGRLEPDLGAIEIPSRGPGGALVCTSFREESDYGEDRRPRRVRFVDSVEVDARRRDFRLNAIYCEWPQGEWVDPLGGLEDVEQRRLAVIGDPARRLEEDPLRCLRALRFAARLQLSIEAESAQALDSWMPSIARLSADRIRSELVPALIDSQASSATWEMLDRFGVVSALDRELGAALGVVLPEVSAWSARSFDGDELLDQGAGLAPLVTALHPLAGRRRRLDFEALDPVARLAGMLNLSSDVRRALGGWVDVLDLVSSEWAKVDPADSEALRLLRVEPSPGAERRLGIWLGSERMGQSAERFRALACVRETVSAQRLQEAGVPGGKRLGEALRLIRIACLRRGYDTVEKIEAAMSVANLDDALRNRDPWGG